MYPNRMTRILLVEDDALLAKALYATLNRERYTVRWAADGAQALALFRTEHPDLLLLDWMLPGRSGLEVLRRVRATESEVPVLMLTARVAEDDRVLGLDAGADDYLVKPFSTKELLARVRALLRRAKSEAPSSRIAVGPLVIDAERYEVAQNGSPLELTPTEFQLLLALARHRGRVLSRHQLLEAVRGSAAARTARAVDTAVKRLRRKIEPDPAQPRYLIAVYGLGYKLVAPEDA